tara:strand:+ start:617 stop:832 length:216 start_codon:yes stop_codon:yes gene_type:complete
VLKENWKLAIIDEVYDHRIYGSSKKHYNMLVHVNLVQKDDEDENNDYYEVLIPEFNFISMFVTRNRIKKFL